VRGHSVLSHLYDGPAFRRSTAPGSRSVLALERSVQERVPELKHYALDTFLAVLRGGRGPFTLSFNGRCSSTTFSGYSVASRSSECRITVSTWRM